MTNRRTFSCWAIIQPAEDIPGEWVAHCLDFDVVTQGRSPEHVFAMVQDATAMTACDDLNRGADPAARRAPDEDWGLLDKILSKGQRFDTLGAARAAAGQQREGLATFAVEFALVLQEEPLEKVAPQVPFYLLSSHEAQAVC